MSETEGDRLTETTSENYFQLLRDSFGAMAIGVILFLGAFGVLAWNESRAVDALRGLGQAAKDVTDVSPAPVDPSQDDKLVHLTGELKANAPLTDPELDFAKDGIVRLERTVEMYQWKERSESTSSSQVGGTETKRTTYTYVKQWFVKPIDSAGFKMKENHQNPDMPLRSRGTTAGDATIGARTLERELVRDLEDFVPIAPPEQAAGGFRRSGSMLYKGVDPDMPAIGDVRVTFSGVPSQRVSILAKQRGATLVPYKTSNGYEVSHVVAGDKSADEMIAQERSQQKVLTWVLRFVGFLMFFFGLMNIASPLSALANVIPFVASIVGGAAFIFALGLSIPLTLGTIAVAWVFVRPLFGIGLLVVAALCIFAYRRMRPPHPSVVPSHVAPGAPVPAA